MKISDTPIRPNRIDDLYLNELYLIYRILRQPINALDNKVEQN